MDIDDGSEPHPRNPGIFVQQASDRTWGVWVMRQGVVNGAGSGHETRDEAYEAGKALYDELYT
jgi:hypothetical protein